MGDQNKLFSEPNKFDIKNATIQSPRAGFTVEFKTHSATWISSFRMRKMSMAKSTDRTIGIVLSLEPPKSFGINPETYSVLRIAWTVTGFATKQRNIKLKKLVQTGQLTPTISNIVMSDGRQKVVDSLSAGEIHARLVMSNIGVWNEWRTLGVSSINPWLA